MGVTVVPEIKEDFQIRVKKWLDTSRVIKVDFPDHSEKIVKLALGVQ